MNAVEEARRTWSLARQRLDAAIADARREAESAVAEHDFVRAADLFARWKSLYELVAAEFGRLEQQATAYNPPPWTFHRPPRR